MEGRKEVGKKREKMKVLGYTRLHFYLWYVIISQEMPGICCNIYIYIRRSM